MDDAFVSGRTFIRREARVLDQRLFATLFEGAAPEGVIDALRGYHNPDGGFGHGLEPDKRCPDSLPIDVEVALQAMVSAKAPDEDLLAGACDYLASVAGPDGAVALASPAIEPYPHAVHWGPWSYEPGVNPTAGLAGLLHALDVDHPWVDAATAYTWGALEAEVPSEAHSISEAFVFLEHVPDVARADALRSRVAEGLMHAEHYRGDADDPSYGVTPLHLAPAPDSRARALFATATIERHLDRLERDQQADGGWPLTWEPPGLMPTQEYRAMETVRALRTLDAYGRVKSR